MKIIDCSKQPINPAEMNLFDRTLGTIRNGFSWYGNLQMMESARQSLARMLDARFILLVNCPLPGMDEPAPFIIVGPTGVQVIYATPLKGVYRAKADSWSLMESGHYKQVRPNLVQITASMIGTVKDILRRAGLQTPVDGALLCLNPGMHVETVRPVTRVVMQDGMDRFVANLMQTDVNLPSAAVQVITVTIQQANNPPVPELEGLSVEAALRAEQQTSPKPSLLERVHLTRKQATLLAIIAGAEICLLAAIIFMAIFLA